MKKIILLASICILSSSCATLFTDSKQPITFSGLEGTKIYDTSSNMVLGEIDSSKTITIPIKKKREDKQLVAKKNGYKPSPLLLESSFNNTTLWNILFFPGFFVDLGTQKMNKWETTYVEVNMEKDATNESSK